MKHPKVYSGARARRTLTFLGVCALSLALVILGGAGQPQQQKQPQQPQDARQRRVEPSPSPTPTPKPGTTAPTLNTPPEAGAGVVPTATPDPGGEEVDPEDVVKVETDLVNLNVRVIDRNNRAVNDVRQDEFRVFEDGVPQKIE